MILYRIDPEKPQKPKILAVNQFSITIEWEEPLVSKMSFQAYVYT
jgi:hypothetical protein